MDKVEIIKLEQSIPTTDMKIIDLYNKIDNGLLITQPKYQRKLVWKKQHKYAFINTVLLNFPFPEVCIASSEIDVEKMVATEVVVDGQQRLTTIVDYIKGIGDFLNQKKIPDFAGLSASDKKSFLNYKVSVRDLKDIHEDIIKDIFQRINSTEYSLNTVEKNNALFGDGEIALFCKQLVDKNYTATEDETDVIINPKIKHEINDFFNSKNIFTQNDIKRMYDFQYIMLVTSTILEGNYFGRSTKVDEYLEKFNSSFEDYNVVLKSINDALKIISKLKLSEKSYWYNKANLFTLIIELSKINLDELNTDKLEIELLSLEDKVDLYFSAESEEDLKDISEDEKRYFEDARHGSHEKASREHRGKVIKEILQSSLEIKNVIINSIENKNIHHLKAKNIDYSILKPTLTGLNKNILDAVSGIRKFLNDKNIHNYDNQEFGPDHKAKIQCVLNEEGNKKLTEMSLYRSNGRGDYRIWFSDLKSFVEPNEDLALIFHNGEINILNLMRYDYTSVL